MSFPFWSSSVFTSHPSALAAASSLNNGGVTDPADVDEAVFDVVEQIPPGRVSTYGAIGRLVGVGPRRVARALSGGGGGAVPWFRVVRADGSVAEPVRVRQLELLAGEGVPIRNGRVDLASVGWPER